jgi:formamidopyrimidine-DNA glycosylase
LTAEILTGKQKFFHFFGSFARFIKQLSGSVVSYSLLYRIVINKEENMPELPDLQVFSKNLTKLLKGKKLEKILVHDNKKIKITEKEISNLEGKALKKVFREGKKLFFDFGKDAVLSLHLMLHGKLVYSDLQQPKYALISFAFTKGKVLSITDYQKMANVQLNPERNDTVDALSVSLTAAYLYEVLQQSKAQIKTLLMNQQVIGGIGNAYADEILYEAGIAPQSIANKIPKNHANKLSKSIKAVLHSAEIQILKEHHDIISGEIRDFMKVHNNKLKEDGKGNKIIRGKIGGRTTYYTNMQRVFS